MITPRPYIPVLSSDAGNVTDLQEKTATLLRYILLNPGFTSTIFRNEMISFRTLAAQYGHDRDALCTALAGMIKPALQRIVPEYDPLVSFTANDYNDDAGDPRYVITFDITYIDNSGNIIPGIGSNTFIVNGDGTLDVQYHNSGS